jgi:multiple sugar transport system substrate-binding protein/putative aldouronate transport system substrate-binding protein
MIVTAVTVVSSGTAVKAASVSTTAPPLPAKYKTAETITMYDAYANFQGVQAGWFGKMISDRFNNMKINIIAPNVAGGGDTLYQTRSAAGNLGDLILIDDAKLGDLVKTGLVIDFSSMMKSESTLAKYSVATKNLQSILKSGSKIYGIPSNASLQSPTTPQYDGTNPNFGVYMRWDYYKQLGYPQMSSYSDILNVLQKMVVAHPKSNSGKKTYGLSLFKDWDGSYMALAAKYAYLYGWSEFNDKFVFTNWDASKVQAITAPNSQYYQALKFLWQANQMGILDPDSLSNTWTSITDKITDGQIFMMPWSWNTVDNYNTPALSAKGNGFMFVPVNGQTYLQTGLNPYGANAFAIGSKAQDPQRILDFLNWYGSPEGLMLSENGPEGLSWTMMSNGKATQTTYGRNAKAAKSAVPAQYGGGNYVDGSDNINATIGMYNDINPNTGEQYSPGAWASTIAFNSNALTKDWTAHNGGATTVQNWLLKNPSRIVVQPGNTWALPTESSDLNAMRQQCRTVVKNASWQMVFAKSQSLFDGIWNQMLTQLNGFGYQTVLKTDEGYAAQFHQAIEQTLKDTGTK